MLHQVLVRLLAEGIPITSLEKIVESAIHFGPSHKEVIKLTEKVRGNLGHLICDPFRNSSGQVQVVILEPKLEHHFRQVATETTLALMPQSIERLVNRLQACWEEVQLKNGKVALLVDSSIRVAVRQTIHRSLPGFSVIAYGEIPADLLIDAKAIIRFADVIDPADATEEFDILSIAKPETPRAKKTDPLPPNRAV
jgi:flagellar biosynthesis protein FlhA